MREIKFRAWIQDENSPNQKWDDSGDMLVWEMTYDLAFEEYEPINDLLSGVEHLMQYTGLKDKNGKEIYEGDIVKYYSNTFGETYRWKVATVEYYKSYFGFNDRFWFEDEALSVHVEIPMFGHIRATIIPSDIWQSDLKRCEIIGNIYENPELLK